MKAIQGGNADNHGHAGVRGTKAAKRDCIIGHSSLNRLRFEFVTCILVIYDCVMLPFNLAFDLEKVLSVQAMRIHNIIDLTLRTVYIVDFLLGFRKAYLDDRTGREVREPWKITKRYLKFYFWIDLLSVIPFDLISDSGYLYCLQLLKIIRLSRLD